MKLSSHPWRHFSSLCIFAAAVLLSCSSMALEHSVVASPGDGHIDSISAEGRKINAQGWAATDRAAQQITLLTIYLNDVPVYEGTFERLPRPDVAKSLNRPQWLGSGWRVSFDTPYGLDKGTYKVTATARTGSGDQIALTPSKSAEQLTVIGESHHQGGLIRGVKLFIAGAMVFLVVVFFKATALSQVIGRKFKIALSESLIFSCAVVLVSLGFVSIGLTGSSINLGQPNAPFIGMDSAHIIGGDQAVRSDEWLVLTPLSIAQYNHVPPFPVLNKNLGEDGQNMLIVGMAGVPVAHISAIAKPASWGFFFLDLRRGLSWSWCFSITGCFIALALVLNRLTETHWKQGFLFSALFCCAPYVVAWSNWPAYTVFFPCVMFLCALQILNTVAVYKQLMLGAILGVASAGFVFVLYPAWQISVGYAFLAMTVGVVLRDKLYRSLTAWKIAAYVFGFAVAGIIVTLWWLDANAAIHAMTQTVYPGRRLEAGGGVASQWLLRGFTNIITMMELPSPLSNKSEIASFYYLLLPLLALLSIRAIQMTLTAVELMISLAIGFILLYMFFGIPVGVAKYTLWSQVPARRADLALGLCSLILAHLLMSRGPNPGPVTATTRVIAVGTSVAWIYVVYRSVMQLDGTLIQGLNSSVLIAILLMVAGMSYGLVAQQFKLFMLMSLGLSLATTLSFNPVSIAPGVVDVPADELEQLVKNKKVLTINNGITPMFLVASGVPVVNGTFYYPQKSLWKRLDPLAQYVEVYNRYQHLHFVAAEPDAKDVELYTRQADVVTVSINLRIFDFSLSGAQIVLAPVQHKELLAENSSVRFVMETPGWCWFEVRGF